MIICATGPGHYTPSPYEVLCYSIQNAILLIIIHRCPYLHQSQRGPVERGSVREAADRAHTRRLRRTGGHCDRLRHDVAQLAPIDAVSNQGRPRVHQ